MSIDIAVMTEVTPRSDVDNYPPPPSLHWALVLVFWMLTGGLFGLVWIYRQAAWVRRIDPSSKALWVLVCAYACAAVLPLVMVIVGMGGSGLTVTVLLTSVGFAVAWIWSNFSMRQSLEARFDLQLSGILTFFVPVFYLQYRLTRIAKGVHTPHRHGLSLSTGPR